MALETQSYLVGDLVVPRGWGGIYLLHAASVPTFTLTRPDGRVTMHHADIYGPVGGEPVHEDVSARSALAFPWTGPEALNPTVASEQ